MVVREVWASNLKPEFDFIWHILPRYGHIAFDTKSPGFIQVQREVSLLKDSSTSSHICYHESNHRCIKHHSNGSDII